MALTHRDDANEMMSPAAARGAGVASLIGAALLIAAPLLFSRFVPEATGHTALLTIGIILAGCVALAGGQMLRLVTWAQSLAVAVWIAVGCIGLLVLLMSLLGVVPDGWPDRLKTGLAGGILLVLSAVETILAHLGSAAGSRQRYSSTALVTVGEVVALLLVVNVIVQTGYVRFSAETLGRFGLSDRTRRVLENVDDKITFTCVYTASKSGREAEEYRTRLLELLREMEEFRPANIRVENVTTEGAKERLMARLSRQREQKHSEHLAFARAFRQSVPDLRNALAQDLAPLTMGGKRSYLDQWRLRGSIAQRVSEISETLASTREKIDRKLKAGVVQYGDIVSDANEALTKTEEFTIGVRQWITDRSRIPATVQREADEALTVIDQAIAQTREIPEAVIDPNGANVEEMKVSIGAMANALDGASEACRTAAQHLRSFGGKELHGVVYSSDAWDLMGYGIGEYFQEMARNLGVEAANYRRAKSVLRQEDELRIFLRSLRRNVGSIPPAVVEGKRAFQSAVTKLTQVDEQTRAIFQAVAENRLLADTAGILKRLTPQVRAMPEADDTLTDELAGENIVLMEVGDKRTIVPFDDVWPLGDALPPGADEDQPDPREFNGDSAIASALLKLVRKPFAKVVLAHYSPPSPPQMHPMMRQMMPQSSLPPNALKELQDRLREANFLVEKWNLTDPAPWDDPNASDANVPTTAPTGTQEDRLPRLLLVCPPAVADTQSNPFAGRMPQFGPEQVDRIRREINRGSGAVFLTHFHGPRRSGMYGRQIWTPPYLLDDYLKEEWGIDPLNEYVVFPTSRDPQSPDRLTPNLRLFEHLPLNAYTDHPVGEPLQGRRTLWRMVCPVVEANSIPDGVTVRPVLRVPETMDTVWASKHFLDLVRQFREENSAVTPQFDQGDMRPPFPVVMAATRSGADTPDARVVVLGTAVGLADGHLDQPVVRSGEDGGSRLTDPPSANADLVINSALWLTGWDQYIASGPAQIEPIEMMDTTARRILWAIYVAAIPAFVLVIGALVMSIRRRQ